MNKAWRNVMIAAAILVVGLAGWLYYHLVLSTNAALRHAEAFLFRRMTVAQLSDPGTYRFHFITNRVPTSTEAPLLDRFGNRREETLRFGAFDTRIEPTLGLGMITNRTAWFQNQEIQLGDVAELSREAFVQQLRPLVERSPYRGVLVVVHGFRAAFPSALRKTAFVGHVLDVNAPVLVFDWPGNQGSTPVGYRRARQVAQDSGSQLAETLELIIQEVQPERVWLLANSMGGEVVVHAFHALYDNPDLADAETELEDVVLTAPDVDHEEFDSQFKPKITALAKNLTVYVSSNDRALLMSRILNRGRRRGESTLSPDQLAEAVRVAEMVEPSSDQITLVDVTPVNRTRNFHSFSLETPEFFDDLYLRLTNRETPRNRLLYKTKTDDGSVYWVLTRGR